MTIKDEVKDYLDVIFDRLQAIDNEDIRITACIGVVSTLLDFVDDINEEIKNG